MSTLGSGPAGDPSRGQPGSVGVRASAGAERPDGTGPSPLRRWGELVTRRRPAVFAIWLVLVVVGLAFVPRLISSLSLTGLRVPGSESSQAAELLARDLPASGPNQVVLVFTSSDLTADSPAFRQVVAASAGNVTKVRGVAGVEVPYGAAAHELIARGGHAALAVVALGASDEGKAEQVTPAVISAATKAATNSVHVEATGEPALARDLLATLNADLFRSDAVGMPVAIVVLLFVFGGLVAAGLPLLLAVASLAVVLGGFGVFTALTGSGVNMLLESSTEALTLGIGIDYALFILTRFREELTAGSPPAEAAAAATATAGRTVAVSGSIVIITLAPVLLVNDPMMRYVVLGPMVAVAVLAAAALSLLPAVLAGSWAARLAPSRSSRWLRLPWRPGQASRLTALVLRRPLTVLVTLLVPLVALSLATAALHVGLDYGLAAVGDRPTGHADAAIVSAFGPGAISPVQIVLATGGQPLSDGDVRAIARLDGVLSRDPRVASVISLPGLLGGVPATDRALGAAANDPALAAELSPVVNARAGATLTVITVAPRAAFDSAQATQLVNAIRAELPVALRGTGMHALTGGATAAIVDFNDEVSGKTVLVLALIVALAMLLLATAFRSPLVALAGLVGTLVSVAAAYGLLVLVFQEGAGQAVFGFHSPGFIQSWLPLLLFAMLTGLSTDYQVFLVSRVKEEWDAGADSVAAIAEGLRRSGPVILSAATIMVIVFASLLFASELELKEMGFALAVVVIIDSGLVRRLLVPAALRLLGERAWGQPAR